MKNNKDLRKKILRFSYINGFEKNGKYLNENLKLKKSTVDYVLDKLQKEKYYSKYRYEINMDSVGLGKFAWVFLSIDWGNFDFPEFIEKALGMPQVSIIADITGDYDLAIKVYGPSVQSINSFVLGFEKIFQTVIRETKIYFANKEVKRHYLKLEKSNKMKLTSIDYKILCEKNQNPKMIFC